MYFCAVEWLTAVSAIQSSPGSVLLYRPVPGFLKELVLLKSCLLLPIELKAGHHSLKGMKISLLLCPCCAHPLPVPACAGRWLLPRDNPNIREIREGGHILNYPYGNKMWSWGLHQLCSSRGWARLPRWKETFLTWKDTFTLWCWLPWKGEKGDIGMTTLGVVLKSCVKKASQRAKGCFPMGKVFLRVSQFTLTHSTFPPPLPAHTTKLSQSLFTLFLLSCTTFFWNLGGFFSFWRQDFQEAAAVKGPVLQLLRSHCCSCDTLFANLCPDPGGWVILTFKDPLWLKK